VVEGVGMFPLGDAEHLAQGLQHLAGWTISSAGSVPS
jgi:hypothetical protein